MKIHLYNIKASENTESSSVDIPGLTLTGPLLLRNEVSLENEAIHKQYVDSSLLNLNANNIKFNIMPVARMPAYIGDATSLEGTTQLNLLQSTTLIPQSYCKINVNSKGLVIEGLNLDQSDLPSIPWSKLTLDRHDRLAGYGITDALTSNDGQLTGHLILSGPPVDSNDIATKQYVDLTLVNTVGGLAIGDIINRPTNVSMNGFLRCNGAAVSKVDYAALYAIVGNSANTDNSISGSGRPWALQYDINSNTDADITNKTINLQGDQGPSVFSFCLITTTNRVFVIGGRTISNETPTAAIYTATINSSGVLSSSWSSTTSLPVPVADAAAVVVNGKVYLIGGVTTGNSVLSSVYVANINSDGSLGTWTIGVGQIIQNLHDPLYHHTAFITSGYLYVLGGYNGNNTVNNKIYYCKMGQNQSFNNWQMINMSSNNFFSTATYIRIIPTKNRIYAINDFGKVVVSVIDNSGLLGAWTNSLDYISTQLITKHVFVTSKFVYLFTRDSSAPGVRKTTKAPINPDGTLGTWISVDFSCPTDSDTSNGYFQELFVTSTRIYLVNIRSNGSQTTGAISNKIYYIVHSGGVNDYINFINFNSENQAGGTTFLLPDYSSYETLGSYYYIKT